MKIGMNSNLTKMYPIPKHMSHWKETSNLFIYLPACAVASTSDYVKKNLQILTNAFETVDLVYNSIRFYWKYTSIYIYMYLERNDGMEEIPEQKVEFYS